MAGRERQLVDESVTDVAGMRRAFRVGPMTRLLPTKHEAMQLMLGLLGLAADAAWGHRGPVFFLVCVAVGLVCELASRPLWSFHPSLAQSAWTVRGVSLFIGIAWAGLITGGLAVASRLGGEVPLPFIVVLGVVMGVLGNVIESLFAWTGALQYRVEHPVLAFPFRRAPLVFGVPASIRFGYFTSFVGLAFGLSVALG